MLFIVVFCVTLALIFYWFRTRNANYWKNKGVPKARGSNWFFGHFKPVIMKERHYSRTISEVYHEFPEASLVSFQQMNIPALIVKDPELIKAVLTTEFNSFGRNQIMVEKSDFLMGKNPFALWGESWKKTRGHATPAVTFMKLKGYLPPMLAVGDEMLKYVRSNFDENGVFEIDAKELSAKYTLDVVANAVLGIKNNGFEDTESIVGVLTENIFDSFFLNNLRTMMHFLFPDIVTSTRFATKKSETILLSFTRKMLKDKAESAETTTDLFEQLLTARKNHPEGGEFTDEYIASSIYSFLLDGYETSSILICYTLFELAWHDEIQDKLRAEIRELLTRTQGKPNAEDIESLKYLDMVISENLRLHPPAPLLNKICTKPYTMNNVKGCEKSSINIDVGDFLTIPVMALHLDPKYYPNPEQFDPDRFTADAVAIRHKYVYLPFGEGPRKCLGQRFGLMQAKVAIIKTVGNFHLKPSSKSEQRIIPDPAIYFINRPLNGAWIQLEKIK